MTDAECRLLLCRAAVTPPGYETVNGITRECADGFYRAEWVAPGANATCRACGDGLASDTTDTIWLYAITPDANKTSQPVRISSSACCKHLRR